MGKIIEKAYTALLYVFLVLFLVLIRLDANAKSTIFFIGLMLEAIFIATIPFFINKCKKISVRRWYLIALILESLFVILEVVQYFMAGILAKNESLTTLTYWILTISQGLFLTAILFLLFYVVKDWFKKGYTFEKLDLQTITLFLNTVVYALLIYVTFASSAKPTVEIHYNLDFTVKDVTYSFVELNGFLWNVFYVSIGYIVLYILMKGIEYFCFDKKQ